MHIGSRSAAGRTASGSSPRSPTPAAASRRRTSSGSSSRCSRPSLPGAGTGLGLAITRRIVEELGGEIHIESRPGDGTRVVVGLPVARPPADGADAVETVVPVPEVHGRILVVDDELSVRQAVGAILGGSHEVVPVGSAAEARQLLEDDAAIDVVLCDLMMPDGPGIDLHAWLAARRPAHRAQLAFITGGVFTPRTRAYLAEHTHVRIDKPFDASRLRRQVADLILAARSGRGTAT